MQSSSTKRAAGGAIAVSTLAVDAKIKLVPNDTPGGGNFYAGWQEHVSKEASGQTKELALHLSFVNTGVRYSPPLPNRADITAKNTKPAVPAGPDDDTVPHMCGSSDGCRLFISMVYRCFPRSSHVYRTAAGVSGQDSQSQAQSFRQ